SQALQALTILQPIPVRWASATQGTSSLRVAIRGRKLEVVHPVLTVLSGTLIEPLHLRREWPDRSSPRGLRLIGAHDPLCGPRSAAPGSTTSSLASAMPRTPVRVIGAGVPLTGG
ncbi:hypothetical protein V6Z69_09295, partial [Cereibacter sphaeroides]|uniref:hypothetical protein n=1 Tax=Cereibacter sphaeroides TaxID=1063 RepID=UPI0039905BD6